MAEEVSVLRLYVMRFMYLLNCVLVGSGVWAHAAVLQDILAARSVRSSAGGRPFNRPYAGILDRNRIGHYRDPLDVCICALHQEARR